MPDGVWTTWEAWLTVAAVAIVVFLCLTAAGCICCCTALKTSPSPTGIDARGGEVGISAAGFAGGEGAGTGAAHSATSASIDHQRTEHKDDKVASAIAREESRREERAHNTARTVEMLRARHAAARGDVSERLVALRSERAERRRALTIDHPSTLLASPCTGMVPQDSQMQLPPPTHLPPPSPSWPELTPTVHDTWPELSGISTLATPTVRRPPTISDTSPQAPTPYAALYPQPPPPTAPRMRVAVGTSPREVSILEDSRACRTPSRRARDTRRLHRMQTLQWLDAQMAAAATPVTGESSAMGRSPAHGMGGRFPTDSRRLPPLARTSRDPTTSQYI